MTGQVDHPPNGAFHIAAPGAWSCSETAPAIARTTTFDLFAHDLDWCSCSEGVPCVCAGY